MSATAVESRHHDNSDVNISWEDSGIVIGQQLYRQQSTYLLTFLFAIVLFLGQMANHMRAGR